MAQLAHIWWPLLRATSASHKLLEKQTEKRFTSSGVWV